MSIETTNQEASLMSIFFEISKLHIFLPLFLSPTTPSHNFYTLAGTPRTSSPSKLYPIIADLENLSSISHCLNGMQCITLCQHFTSTRFYFAHYLSKC